jgi:hypothetical protein
MKSKSMVCSLFLTLSLLILAGCSPKLQPTAIELTSTVNQSTEKVVTKSPLPISTPTSTMEPLPTLNALEKVDQVRKLKEENGDCDFPCWWGVMPGSTNWEAVAEKFLPIASKHILFTRGQLRMHYLEFPSAPKVIIASIFLQGDDVIDVIRTSWEYSVIDVLHDYGQPKEIWISSDGIVPGPSMFRIAFFYPQKGIMAAYVGQATIIVRNGAEFIRMCATKFNSSGPLWLWAPDTKTQLEELPIENLTGKPPSSLRFQRINEYTDFDEAIFYTRMLKDINNTCLETKADIWPNPDPTAMP